MVISTLEQVQEIHDEFVMDGAPMKELIKADCKEALLTETLSSGAREPRYKNIVHLWEFLLELLARDNCKTIICWSRKEHREFKLKNPEEVAKRWGLWKGKKGMNYEKLSRALRYYYQQGIIKKVPSQRLVYKFHRLPYKYEPGVTRSLSHTRQIEAASLTPEQEHKPVTTPPPEKTTGFTPISPTFIPTATPMRKDWCWPLVPVPTRPVWCCPSSFMKPPMFSTGSRIMYPFVDTLTSLPLGFKPVESVPAAYEMFPFSKTSIPVSVIQRTV